MTLPTPQGINPGTPPWYQLIASDLGCLLQPSLTDPPPLPPSLSSTAEAYLPAIAGRQAKNVWSKLDTVLKNPDRYWLGMPGKSLQLAPATSKCSPRLVCGYSTETGGPPKTFCPNNNMSGFLKMVLMSTQQPRPFSKKIPRIFSSINHRQPVNTQPTLTHLACVWLAGLQPIS